MNPPRLAGWLAAVILVSFLFSAWAQLYAKSKERAVLEAALATVSKEVLGEETAHGRFGAVPFRDEAEEVLGNSLRR